MPFHQLGQLLCNLLPDLAILRGFFRREAAITGDASKSHRRCHLAYFTSASHTSSRCQSSIFRPSTKTVGVAFI